MLDVLNFPDTGRYFPHHAHIPNPRNRYNNWQALEHISQHRNYTSTKTSSLCEGKTWSHGKTPRTLTKELNAIWIGTVAVTKVKVLVIMQPSAGKNAQIIPQSTQSGSRFRLPVTFSSRPTGLFLTRPRAIRTLLLHLFKVTFHINRLENQLSLQDFC